MSSIAITITHSDLPTETVARERAQGRLTIVLVEDAQYYGAWHYTKAQAWDDAARMLAAIDSGAASVEEAGILVAAA